MFRKIPKPTAATLMTAIMATVCACHSDEVTPPLTLTTLPAQQASPEPPSFVGTVPVPRSDERTITPMETVAAAPD